MSVKIFIVVLGTISTFSIAGLGAVRAADTLRLRGTVVSSDASLLTVKDRQGGTDAGAMAR
ncbi:MAG: hypothetical protein E5V49_01980 [Mesorhizobium sp.]|nr:hypothetical protein EN848_07620 [bacterium M00.F.Ca.ET.205.01.1.1]TGU53916.1 hypothetical protein EN795_12045 [bacterium M00.F.Ca.ET.152.01.1.1]TGV37414.1 hypothetical protein EN829_012070 [Mesorhizobium sp. M00.F.Ca.ET.186.01.1.1]TGZ41225.1 hypothetical protein EN805_20780 [bacterium M00.F.Ca.ET.162.01.1.1]TIW62219.1 MAG: hypothetical protein E5V48_05520 [Mesorhizobium sp.]